MQEKFVQKNSGRFEVQDASKDLNVCTEYMPKIIVVKNTICC